MMTIVLASLLMTAEPADPPGVEPAPPARAQDGGPVNQGREDPPRPRPRRPRARPRAPRPIGVIVPYPMPPSLVIRHTPQTHDEIASLLRQLRR